MTALLELLDEHEAHTAAVQAELKANEDRAIIQYRTAAAENHRSTIPVGLLQMLATGFLGYVAHPNGENDKAFSRHDLDLGGIPSFIQLTTCLRWPAGHFQFKISHRVHTHIVVGFGPLVPGW